MPTPHRVKLTWCTSLCAVLIAGFASMPQAQRTLLVPGMHLSYSSNGQVGAPWRVESVQPDIELGGRSGCLRVVFAAGAPRPVPDVRVTCEEAGVLAAWDSVQKVWRPTRPVRAGGTLDGRSGTNTVRYIVDAESQDTVSGVVIRVLATQVITRDSTGKEIRRLRERYAPELGTATWGTFETPDAAAPGGWRVTQEFRLVAIKKPQ